MRTVQDRALGPGIGVLLFAATIPTLHAQGAVPVSLIYGTSETTAAPTTSIELTQESLRDYKGPALTSVVSDVTTQAELIDFAATLMQEDSHIERITLDMDEVTMTYRSQERIPRFGHRMFERTVHVSSTGAVTVERPWFAAFGEDDDPEIGFSDIRLVADQAGLTAQTQARILMRMQGRFEIGAL